MPGLDMEGLSFADRTADQVRDELNHKGTRVVLLVSSYDAFMDTTYDAAIYMDRAGTVCVSSINTREGIGGIAYAPDAQTAFNAVHNLLAGETLAEIKVSRDQRHPLA